MSSIFCRWSGSRLRFLFYLLLLTLAIATVSCSFGPNSGSNTQTTPTHAGPVNTSKPSGLIQARGADLVDGTGHQVVLRGADLESPFIYIKGWNQGKRPTDLPINQIFTTMAHDWNMNLTRVPISPWIYNQDTATYMSQLDQYVQTANAAGLYVVLDMHDDAKAGSPYGNNATLPKAEDVTFWKAIATHYKDNPMVMFDVYNEPKAPNWQTWLHGGGTVDGAHVVGFQDLVDAIRSVGAKQVIVVEPGSAGGKGAGTGTDPNAVAEEGGWSTIGTNTINDPNIMYSLHVYQGIVAPTQVLDAKWGPILNHYPIFYGEWALLPNGSGKSGMAHCAGIAPGQADNIVNNFLNYTASRNASWSAWQFAPHTLVQDYSTFAPTSLDTQWTCGDQKANVGMGALIKQYLTGGH